MHNAQIVAHEAAALRRWTTKRADGSAVPGEAFGICMLDYSSLLDLDCLKAKDYYFSIGPRDGRLELVVDSYECSGRGTQAGMAWDVDQWDAEKIVISANPTRCGFRVLARIGRTLVAGRDVVLSDGSLVSGVRKVGGAHA
ncbi:hypothetical protein [Comamonas fluminis]|uniref:hypothetical protein n=1 Tax=Comamonas fluminis TaxID=2796366 RepID=UPI001C443D90|nr:hypothetical protein [Comamonas fluminis]